MKKIALIDYGAGNIQSVYNALLKTSEIYNIDISVNITSSVKEIENADNIILPGVGSFWGCMNGLLSHDGLKDALDKAVLKDKKLFLGICVGMQLLAEYGHENGTYEGLGYIKGDVKRLEEKELKIPHMGWNKLNIKSEHELTSELNDGDYFYFVHSYYFDAQKETVKTTCNYGNDFPALVVKDNIAGSQFHPEKSHDKGLVFLRNFLTWKI